MNLVEAIVSKNLNKAKEIFEQMMDTVVYDLLAEQKKIVAMDYVWQDLEEEVLEEGKPRIQIIKARVRNGKIQRRKKVSGAVGYKMQGGRLTRMSPAERRRRKLGQRSGRIKRRQKMVIALKRRKRSLLRRRAFGG